MEYVKALDFARLAKSHVEMSDQIVVLTAIVGAMVTRASVDYERLEDCLNFAAKRYRPGHRPALLHRVSSVLHDLKAKQKGARAAFRCRASMQTTVKPAAASSSYSHPL